MIDDSHCLSVLHNSADGRLTRSLKVSVCMGCGLEIYDQYILRVAPDLEWHAACLKCVDCHQFLDESCTCYVRDGKTYCKRDYDRLFTAKCAKCQGAFKKNTYVMRARNRVFHLECFRCVSCAQPLQTGEEFAMRDDGGLFCKRDYELLEKALLHGSDEMLCVREDCLNSLFPAQSPCSSGENVLTPLTPTATPSNVLCSPFPAGAGSSTPPAILGGGGQNENASSGGGGGNHHHRFLQFRSPSPSGMNDKIIISSGKKKDGQKTTRVRTVLNEKQLHTLRTCYASNPRPDALMKEQLVEMTSLSPRVIRVWFQNKRCKDKKKQILIKQIQQQQEKTQVLNGIRLHQTVGPLIAASPVRHDLSGLMQAVDITQYAPSQHLSSAGWSKMNVDTYMNSPMQLHQNLVDAVGLAESPLHHVPPFQQLLHGFGDPSIDPTAPLGFITQAVTQSQHQHVSSSAETSVANGSSNSSMSPVLANSDLSSPSCSE